MSEEKKVQSSLNLCGVFCIMSKYEQNGEVKNLFEDFFTVSPNNFKDYMFRLVNDFQSPYYVNFDKKFVCKIADIDIERGAIIHESIVPEIISSLDTYISKNMRRYQQTVQVLNYTPTGYYRKSEEERKEIQQRIDDEIINYVTKYVVPDFNSTISQTQKKAICEALNTNSSSSHSV